MRIVHAVDCMEVGGAETLVSQMCRLQREQGHDPCVFTVGTLGPLGEKLRDEGFVVQPHMGRSWSEAPLGFFRAFKRRRPDVVHLHNARPTIYGAAAARMAGVPSIVSTRHGLVAAPRRLPVELKYALAAACCDWIVGICDATVNNLKSVHTVPARKIVRVYNGAAPLQRVAIEQRPPNSGFTLLYAGRLAPVKNHGLLLNAFRAAHSVMPDLRLWMVGDGMERKKLEKLAAELGISEKVTFWGQQLDVAPFFSAADAFIMSSEAEGLPISLLQGLSLGLPAIVTDVGGMAEAIQISRAGITVSATDPSEMVAAILRLAGSESERRQFSTSAEAAYRARFTPKIMSDAYMDLYLNTVRVRRSAGFGGC
jgi:glycosyltransferase involved in cell wall biosynthesis